MINTNKFNLLLNKPIYFRYAFVILFVITITSCLFFKSGEFYLLYILLAMLLGVGFYNKSIGFLITLTITLVVCRYFLVPESSYSFGSFIVQLITYLLIVFISVGLMSNYQKINSDHFEMIKTLANVLDSKDPYTRHHSEKVAKYGLAIAKQMKLPKQQCDVIYTGGLLHDIGKIGISGSILSKPGKLDDSEYDIVKRHPQIGYDIIKHVSNFYQCGILDIVLYHHERFDGKGYPKGLKGTDIPLVARIIAVADTFDAMTSRRIYRSELDIEMTLNEIRSLKGTQFDPEVVEAFLYVYEEKEKEWF